MIARLFLRFGLVLTSVMMFGTRSAHAACTISDLTPINTLPTSVRDGEWFVFRASADCVTLEFTSGAFSTTPVPGSRPVPGPITYRVKLAPPVWNSLVNGRDTTFEWTVTGWTSAGVSTEVTTINELDFDHDGWTRTDGDAGTCDHDATRHPGATETCDGIDQDCDGLNDDITWFRDADRDGYGDDADWVVASCHGGRGHVAIGGDCDDADAAINPVAREICDDVDDDCDGLACSLALPGADAAYTGEAILDAAGNDVDGAGDVNGDGYDDVLVGAEYNEEGGIGAGAAYIILGGPSPASASLSDADAKYTGEGDVDLAGVSVAGAGDVDGDGYGDVLVGAHNYYAGNTGAAYLVLGGPSPTSASLSAADAKYTGEAAGDYANRVAGAGDVDGDGHDDLLVGSTRNAEAGAYAGAAYLLLGGPTPASASLSAADAKYTGEAASDNAGAVAGAGDIDGDGYGDILVGSFANDEGGDSAGAAYLLLGGSSPASASLSAADAKYTGEGAGDYAGIVAGAGDIDGDGYDDMLVGAAQNDDGGEDAGAVYLLLGGPFPSSTSLSSADAEYTGQAGDYAGTVAGAGDVDGGGYADILVGAVGADHHAGAAYLVLGDPSPASASLSAADARYNGRGHDYAGISVAGAGDVDHDGHDDVLVGAYQNNVGGRLAGAAYLLLDGGF